ncbi:amino acid adenylation domain-containing protein [Paraburkholderia kirstenboschensis]|uniref:Amino acid adenylation domain-containing protein n=1 Tax=Paraburkholderia kirstenboschensis TaxID=1245436 RepID=A0ABZ0ESS6_9BURK|nr:amino acid adenylation domain-containing protein [Paraburkholderia kirstenboschensis]WOD20208.1 amino acid adenylation domain-containing protein [Paraburkholderia kirstenboschensis]
MLDSFFFDTAASEPERPALWVDEHLYCYGELASRASRIAAGLTSAMPAGGARRCLLFAHRSVAAYAGLLGIMKAGFAYVPLNPTLPAARIAAAVEQSKAPVLLVDRRCTALLDDVLMLIDECPKIFFIDDEKDLSGMDDSPAHRRVADLPRLPGALAVAPPHAAQRALHDHAYVLFTSGSTGAPKGVAISHANACAYVTAQLQLLGRLPDARYAQFCELSFDPSVHDMFVCWANGACLYVPKTTEPIYNAAFIREHAITHWNSVPSVAAFMQQFRKLPPNEFESLRVTCFGGEPLPVSLAQAWQKAAPKSRIFNLYGPTETTVACSAFEVTPQFLADATHAVMPLGQAVPGMELLIVDATLQPVAQGESGELLIGGPQVAAGYLRADEPNNRRFVTRRYAGLRSSHWYRSGDAAREVPRDGIVFQGRLDTQVKIRGNRIEIEEVEHVVQTSSRAALCAVIAWPVDEAGRAHGLLAFVTRTRIDAAQILQACRQRLPAYAVPQRVIALDAMPLNANGKIDRRALAAQCASGNALT